MTQISISEASRRWGVSRSTVQRRIKSGELSLTVSDTTSKNNTKLIDISELIRVFGEPVKQGDTRSQVTTSTNKQQLNDTALIEQLKAENNYLKQQLEKATDHNHNQDKKLLEYQTKPLWKKLLGK